MSDRTVSKQDAYRPPRPTYNAMHVPSIKQSRHYASGMVSEQERVLEQFRYLRKELDREDRKLTQMKRQTDEPFTGPSGNYVSNYRLGYESSRRKNT